jgi:uncharacterized protein with PIN domain
MVIDTSAIVAIALNEPEDRLRSGLNIAASVSPPRLQSSTKPS